MPRHRLGLALTGGVLLCAGAFALAVGLGAFGPGVRSASVIGGSPTGDSSFRLGSGASGFWSAVVGIGGVLALAGLIGLTVQLKTVVIRHAALGRVAPRMAVRVAKAGIVEEVERLPGVQGVRAKLTGTALEPRLVMTVTCDARTDIGMLQREIAGGPIQRLRVALGRSELQTVICYRVAQPAQPAQPANSAEAADPIAPTVAVEAAMRH